MNSCGTDPLLQHMEELQKNKLPVICLLPEFPVLDGTETAEVRNRRNALRRLYEHFGDRCERSIVLTTDNGLVDLSEAPAPSEKRFEDLSVTQQHDWIMIAKPQLIALLRPGLRVVCLAAGPLLKAIRRMELNVICPLTGMSERLRRRWLEARLGESNFAVGFCLTGGVGNPLAN